MPQSVPKEFLTLVNQSVIVTDTHAATEFPKFGCVIIPCSVSLYIGLHMKLFVELLEENTFNKLPSLWVAHHIDLPSLGNNTVFYDARVADQRIDAITGHHRDRVAVVNSMCRVFLGFFCASNHEQCS